MAHTKEIGAEPGFDADWKCAVLAGGRLSLLLGPAGKSSLAAGADESLHGLAVDLDVRLLKVRLEAAVCADPVHPGRLRIEAVNGDLPANGAGASHKGPLDYMLEDRGPDRGPTGRYDSTPFR